MRPGKHKKRPSWPLEVDDGPQVVGEATTSMNDVYDLHHNNDGDAPNYEELVCSLNADQGRVLEQIKHQAFHENNKCKCTDFRPLHLFVSGVGGTGKSFLIKTIRELMSKIWDIKTGSPVCAVTAPTGLAAFNVGATSY